MGDCCVVIGVVSKSWDNVRPKMEPSYPRILGVKKCSIRPLLLCRGLVLPLLNLKAPTHEILLELISFWKVLYLKGVKCMQSVLWAGWCWCFIIWSSDGLCKCFPGCYVWLTAHKPDMCFQRWPKLCTYKNHWLYGIQFIYLLIYQLTGLMF